MSDYESGRPGFAIRSMGCLGGFLAGLAVSCVVIFMAVTHLNTIIPFLSCTPNLPIPNFIGQGVGWVHDQYEALRYPSGFEAGALESNTGSQGRTVALIASVRRSNVSSISVEIQGDNGRDVPLADVSHTIGANCNVDNGTTLVCTPTDGSKFADDTSLALFVSHGAPVGGSHLKVLMNGKEVTSFDGPNAVTTVPSGPSAMRPRLALA